MVSISNPSNWQENYRAKGTKYDKIVEMIGEINSSGKTDEANTWASLQTFTTGVKPANLTSGEIVYYDGTSLTSTSPSGLTTAYLEDLLMYGAGNAAWLAVSQWVADDMSYMDAGAFNIRWSTNPATGQAAFTVPTPTNRGGLKLYVKGIRLILSAADANNYIDAIECRVVDNTGTISLVTGSQNLTNRTASGEYDHVFTAVDVSSYRVLYVTFAWNCNAAYTLRIAAILCQVYYST